MKVGYCCYAPAMASYVFIIFSPDLTTALEMQNQTSEETKIALRVITILNENQEAELNRLSEQNQECIMKVMFSIKQTCLSR